MGDPKVREWGGVPVDVMHVRLSLLPLTFVYHELTRADFSDGPFSRCGARYQIPA